MLNHVEGGGALALRPVGLVLRPPRRHALVERADLAVEPVVGATDARELGLEGKQTLGFIGSFYAYEGLDVLLRSLPKMLPVNPDLRVLLVGGGPQEQALKVVSRNL